MVGDVWVIAQIIVQVAVKVHVDIAVKVHVAENVRDHVLIIAGHQPISLDKC